MPGYGSCTRYMGCTLLSYSTKFEGPHNCLFGMCFFFLGGGGFSFLRFSVVADLPDPLPMMDNFSHCSPQLDSQLQVAYWPKV